MATDIYSRMAGVANRLLAPTSQGGLGQGTIVLSHTEPGTPAPGAPSWEPVEPVITTETLRGAVRGVGKELIGTEFSGPVMLGGNKIMSSDKVALCGVPTIQFQAGDTLIVDGAPSHILSWERIPAAGTTSAVKFIIRG